jgi:trehalose/maltose hydrolase-like predicted phosphorylase
LTRAAEETVSRLGARGLETRVVSQRLNRRKIDLIPVEAWSDPPKSQIDQLLCAVEERLHRAGFNDLAEVATLATDIARDAGIADPRVTSDAKHVEIGLTDKTDSARAVLAQLWADGIAPEQLLIGGDEFGTLGGLAGSDSLMLVGDAAAAVAFSVGIEPNGVPAGVAHLGGGPAQFLDVLREQLRRRSDLPHVASRDGWSVVVERLDPVAGESHDALLTLADGLIGTKGTTLLGHPGGRPEVLAAGVFDHDGPFTDLLAGPHWATLSRGLTPGDEVRRVLDLRTAVLGEDVDGATRMRSVRFSSFARPGITVLRADIEPPESSDALTPVDGMTLTHLEDGAEWTAARGTSGSITAAGWQQRKDSRLDRIAAYTVGTGNAEPDHAAARLARARADGFDSLLAEHRRRWSRRWERADIRVDGDPSLQLNVRLALFHLMSSVADHGEAAVGARGMTGHDYRGHVFWDADLFVLPFLAATEPAAARAMLEYRRKRLPAARAAAQAEHRRGARFPWESAASGFDVTPRAVHDARDRVVPIRTGESEVHIVGDIAWAVCCYLDWTGDQQFAAGAGRDILIETARYWASRIRLDNAGRAHLYGVIGPDEYHEPVDDNAFTNVLARWNLRRAAAAAATIDDTAVSPEEPAAWQDLADRLVDGYDPATGLYEEFAGFYDLDPTLVRDIVANRPVTADLLLGADRVRRAQIVKQTDVLMLHHLVPDEVEPGSLGANLDFYEPRTAHGSSLSLGIHAAIFARAGRHNEAVAALRTAADIDEGDVTRTGAGGVHLGAMGSVWQALAYGFAGLRPRGDALAVDPKLGDALSGLDIGVQFRGVPLRLRLEQDLVVVNASSSIVLVIADQRVTCPPGETHIPREDTAR